MIAIAGAAGAEPLPLTVGRKRKNSGAGEIARKESEREGGKRRESGSAMGTSSDASWKGHHISYMYMYMASILTGLVEHGRERRRLGSCIGTTRRTNGGRSNACKERISFAQLRIKAT